MVKKKFRTILGCGENDMRFGGVSRERLISGRAHEQNRKDPDVHHSVVPAGTGLAGATGKAPGSGAHSWRLPLRLIAMA
jgi:hypothetical protein